MTTTRRQFTVRGIPVPKGSMSAFNDGHGRPRITSKTKGLSAWQTAVSFVLQSEWNADLLEGPVQVVLLFGLLKPKAAKKHEFYVYKRPDIDKLARAVLDGMTGIVFRDDSQVASLQATKCYAGPEGPGVVIVVSLTERP